MDSVKLVGQRGTEVHDSEYRPPSWAGEPFIQEQTKNLSSLPSKTVLCTRRGTVILKVTEFLKVSKTRSIKGFVISTARGTATRVL